MTENKLITPRKLKGFWELMPKEQMLFSSLLQKIEKVFQDNCFLPLDTPVLEYSDALLAKSGGETDKQVFRFSKGDADMCMRYDLTVPLARFVSMHKAELCFPFKRYQIGKVYRGERPQKGRFREFYQCDADIIGDGQLSLVADAECINLFEKCFDALSLPVEIKVSNRKIISGFIEEIGKTEKSTEIFIVLDKFDKISVDDALEELQEIGLSKKESEKIAKLTQISGKIEEISKELRDFCQNSTFQNGLNELLEVDKYLKSFGCTSVTYNLGVIRGHNYYTGTVFEGFLKDNKVAVGGGGRFENLCSYFSAQKMPGVGMSVGVTRLFDILLQENYFDINCVSETELGVVNFDETLPQALEVVQKLRKLGIKADCLYESKTFKGKLKEANKRQLDYVLFVGENEIKSNLFTLKNMQDGNQESLSLSQIAEKFEKIRKKI